MFVGQKNNASFVDFPHLSERAMLYVVFTFGEMVIAVSNYFKDDVTFNNMYFAGMVFLIVVGLFLS
ncbi:MAG: low temperature requirement protein A, partial [Clostridia bacterium]|nr:low temperature requirement protein A [Clostridia bacterium]